VFYEKNWLFSGSTHAMLRNKGTQVHMNWELNDKYSSAPLYFESDDVTRYHLYEKVHFIKMREVKIQANMKE